MTKNGIKFRKQAREFKRNHLGSIVDPSDDPYHAYCERLRDHFFNLADLPYVEINRRVRRYRRKHSIQVA